MSSDEQHERLLENDPAYELCEYCEEHDAEEFECDECGDKLCGECAQDEQNGDGGIFCPAHER